MRSNTVVRDNRLKIISIGSSSKKAGKSSVAAYLVRELKADYGLKISSGGSHTGQLLIDDPAAIGQPGTDTGALAKAGAKRVLWLDAPPSKLAEELRKALEMFTPGGILVVEGNSALSHLTPDFAVFVMNVPFEDFKPSAAFALEKADLVLVNQAGKLCDADSSELRRRILERSSPTKILVYHDENGLQKALSETARMIRRKLGSESPSGCGSGS